MGRVHIPKTLEILAVKLLKIAYETDKHSRKTTFSWSKPYFIGFFLFRPKAFILIADFQIYEGSCSPDLSCSFFKETGFAAHFPFLYKVLYIASTNMTN